MSKIKSLELRKLLKELEFIESDFEYRSEMISTADSEFINSINIFLKDHPELKEIYDNKVTEKINQSIKKEEKSEEESEEESEENINHDINDDTTNSEDESEDIEENEEEIKNKKHLSQIKKLYREIVKLTHPDKIKNSKLNDLYLKATKYYDDNNKIGIYAVCNELQISYEISDDDISLIYDQITNYKNKISFIESTYTWKWYNCEDDSQKSQILLNYIKMKIK
jgi:hypothetical protein